MLKYLDANACLRYLLDDLPDQAEKVERVIGQSAAFLTPEVVAEVVYVLEGVYEKDRKSVCEALIALVDMCRSDDSMLLKESLAIYRDNRKLDLVDSILAARHRIRGVEVLSFDKALNRRMMLDDACREL